MNWDDILAEQEHLEHWGILGMKWGVRRYQNKDGSLTQAGRARYGSGSSKSLGERYSAYKKARTAKIKEKTMRSGNIKTILKNQKYLTDAEFDKAVARAKKVESLTPKEVKAIKEKKPESEYSKKIKESIVDSLTRKRDWKTPSTQEARDYDIAKAKIQAEKTINESKNKPLKKINLMAVMGKAAKGIGTYMTFAKTINAITQKKTFPTTLADIGEKLGVKTETNNDGKQEPKKEKNQQNGSGLNDKDILNALNRLTNQLQNQPRVRDIMEEYGSSSVQNIDIPVVPPSAKDLLDEFGKKNMKDLLEGW